MRPVVCLLTLPVLAVAQAPSPEPKVAVLDVALYTAGANLQEASDTDRAVLATAVLRGKLQELLGAALVDSTLIAEAAQAPAARDSAGARDCNVVVACARAVGRAVGARWVVMAKVSKTSNLIWLFSGQLIDLRADRFVLDDTTELKGDPGPMIQAGTRIFAERVAREVRREAPPS
jgi:hypothetical protein